jgi:hypothetical protein
VARTDVSLIGVAGDIHDGGFVREPVGRTVADLGRRSIDVVAGGRG